jgi:HK97 family phage prohead protease
MENKHLHTEGPERRTIAMPMEFREEGEEKYFEGTGILFGVATDMGWYTEEVDQSAADDVLGDDVRGLFNHDANLVLGRTKSGTMTITKTGKNISYRIKYNPNDPDHVKAYEKVKRGDVSGSSFSFDVKDDEWSTRNGRDHRKIKRLAALYDMGPVTFPAYDKTKVAARSKENFFKEQKIENDTYQSDLAEMDLSEMRASLQRGYLNKSKTNFSQK